MEQSTGSNMLHLFIKHFGSSIRYYRLTALYMVAGVALATAHIPVKYDGPPNVPVMQLESMDNTPSKSPFMLRFRLDFGEPPSASSVCFHIARIAIAGWLAFLGVFWDVRRRMKEWALIRLYGGYPSLVAGFQCLCLALMGTLLGGGFAFLAERPLSPEDGFWFIVLALGWGLLFSICVSIGPIAYAESCYVIHIFRIEGEVK